MFRRGRIAWIGALVLCGLAVAARGQDNILVIVADDLGVRNVGAYTEGMFAVEGTPPPTPNIDALAAAGALYHNAWAFPVCSPMRASLMSGRYPFRTGVGMPIGGPATNQLELSEVTLPELLAPHGYHSTVVGKWHLNNDIPADLLHPLETGLDYYAGFMQGALPNYYNWPKNINGVQQMVRNHYATTDTVDEALAFIAAQDQPWLCMLWFNAPHTPFHAPPAELHTQDLSGLNPNTDPLPFYKAMIEAMDSEMGRLFRELGPNLPTVLEDTWIVFIADNGTPMAAADPPLEPVDKIKTTVYQGGVHVPLLIAGPGVAPGQTRLELISAVDLFSTIAAMAGVDVRAEVPAEIPLDSVNQLPGLLGQVDFEPRTTVYTETFPGDESWDGSAAIRDQRYKLIRIGCKLSLYDLWTDPLENSDLLLAGENRLSPRQHLVYEQLCSELFTLVPPPADCGFEAN